MIERVKQQWPALAVAAMLGSGSGMGGTVLYLNNIAPADLQRIARPDPATGTQLRALQREMEYHFKNHPDIVNRFDRRLTRLEAQIEIMKQ
ncbi:MAG: hypothetical protein HKM98_02525 [Gammaproteobacteria bacterium]|nr:hypothetical protein [Gammaproteobacteria bacterium]